MCAMGEDRSGTPETADVGTDGAQTGACPRAPRPASPRAAPSSHWYVAYADEASMLSEAGGLLAEGVGAGEQIAYFGWAPEGDLRRRLHRLEGMSELSARGAARVATLDRHFPKDRPPDPVRLVDFWSAATSRALEQGFRGFRVLADTTPWANLAPDGRAVFRQGEQLVNRYRLEHPLTLIYACDASVSDADALVDTACIHTEVRGVDLPFRLHAGRGGELTMSGELDAFSVPLLERALRSAPLLRRGDRLVVDLAGVEFIDHTSLRTLDRHAARSGLEEVVLRGAYPTVARVLGLLDLVHVRIEE